MDQDLESASDGVDWNAAIAKYNPIASQFARVVTFYKDGNDGSEEKCYPCSIDWLLPQTTLTGTSGTLYPGFDTNARVPPTIVWFNNMLHIFFQDHPSTQTGDIKHIVSPDGTSGSWQQPSDLYTGMDCSFAPYAIVYMNQLHLFWRDSDGNALVHSYSDDGHNWKPRQYLPIDIDGQPHGAVSPYGQLYVVCVDHGGNGIMYATTTDGQNFTTGYTGLNDRSLVQRLVPLFLPGQQRR